MKIGEYDGTFKLLKQCRLHSLCGSMSEFDIYALKLKQKSGSVLERIHLEPEDDRTA